MKEILSNPKLGYVIKSLFPLTDNRWPNWRKRQYIHKGLDGVDINIHYNSKFENGILKAVDDFKFL